MVKKVRFAMCRLQNYVFFLFYLSQDAQANNNNK